MLHIRRPLARAVRRLSAASPRVVALDVILADAGDPAETRELSCALGEAPKPVLSCELVEVLIGRRDRQIRYLYERELDFSTTIAGIYRSPSFRLGRTLTWPLRWLRERWKPKPATAGTPGPRR